MLSIGVVHAAIDLAVSRLNASVKDEEELLLVTDKGQLIRTAIDQIRIAGRATQGVILINVSEDEHVVAAERLEALGGEAGDAAEGATEEGGE